MKQNAFFEEMYRAGREWSLKHREHEKLKDQIIEQYGWDSKELEAWYAE